MTTDDELTITEKEMLLDLVKQVKASKGNGLSFESNGVEIFGFPNGGEALPIEVLHSMEKLGYIRRTLIPDDPAYFIEPTLKALSLYDKVQGMPESLMQERRSLVDTRVKEHFSEVVSRLEKAYLDIWIEQPNEDWTGVAHECQSALSAFADKIYEPEMAGKTGDEQLRHEQYEKKMLLAIKSVAGGDSKIGDLLKTVHAYEESLRHDRGKTGQSPTTQREAKRIVLYTYLIIADVYELLNPDQTD